MAMEPIPALHLDSRNSIQGTTASMAKKVLLVRQTPIRDMVKKR